MDIPPRIQKTYTDLTVNSNAGSSTTTDLDVGTRFIRLVADVACRFAFAGTVTGTTGILIPPNIEVYLQVPNSMAQSAQAIATISHTTTAGKLNITAVTP